MKTLAEIFNPDARQAALVTLDVGRWRAMEVRDYHKLLDAVRVTDTAPEAVLEQFEVARDLMLYGWFVYEFYTVASHHAYTCLEFGLREACKVLAGEGNPCKEVKMARGLGCYLTYLKRKGVIPDGRYDKAIEMVVPMLRNDHAHGSNTLLNYALAMPTLEIVADLLNVVFGSEKVSGHCQT